MLRLVVLLCVLAVASGSARAKVAGERDPGPAAAELCLAAADRAAARYGIPPPMMRAITLVETRRTVNGATGPWPWTLNIGGEGFWHASRADALAHAEREMGLGRRSIDLGCFQLNYRWHGENFSGPDAMLDPDLAADYAARFLAGLHAETGDWMRAAGLYHSRTPVHADRYRGLVRRTLARLGAVPEALASLDPQRLAPDVSPGTHPRPNRGGGESEAGREAPARRPAGAAAAAVPWRPGGAERGQGRGSAGGAGAEPGAVRGTPAGAVALSLFAGRAGPILVPAALRRQAVR